MMNALNGQEGGRMVALDGWEDRVGDEGRWEAKGGLYLSFGYRQQCCESSSEHKQPQCTAEAQMVVGSSLALHIALLVPLRGPAMHPSGLTRLLISCL